MTIDGIRPPPANVVFSIATGAPTVQTQVRPGVATSQVRLVTPGTAVVRPGQVLQQRLVTPIRGAGQPQTRMVTIRQPNSTTPVIVSSSQPPALHPVYPNNQVRPGANVVRQPIQVKSCAFQFIPLDFFNYSYIHLMQYLSIVKGSISIQALALIIHKIESLSSLSWNRQLS